MNKVLIFPLVLAFLCGCEVNKMQLAKGEQVCKDGGGLFQTDYTSTRSAYIKYTCKNGKIVRLSYEQYEDVLGDVVLEHLKTKSDN